MSDAISKLRALADAAAQPGPWTTMTNVGGETTVFDANGFWVADCGEAPKDAAFIAACSPDVILALLDVVSAAERCVNAQGLTEQTAAIIGIEAAIDAMRNGAKP